MCSLLPEDLPLEFILNEDIDVLWYWEDVCGPYCNDETNKRCLRLLELTTFNKLVLTNHAGDGHGTAQMGSTTIRLTSSW